MLSFLVFVLGAVGVGAYVFFKIQNRNFGAGSIVSAVLMSGVVFALSQIAGSIVIVGAGERVVVFDKFTGVKKVALGEGFHLITPFVQDAITFDVRVQKEEFETTAASKDLQDVSTKVALNVHPIPEEVPAIYQKYGKDYAEKVVHPAVQESVKAVTARFTAEELITKRETVKNEIQAQLAVFLKQADLVLDETYVTNFKFSEDFSKAIEGKQIAEQEALKAKNTLEQVKIEAEQKIANARAEAEGLRLQKEQITPSLLALRRIEANVKAIEKWDGKLPNTIMGGGAVPFINMDKVAE